MRTEMMIGREGIESKVRRKFQGAMREEPRKAFRQALTRKMPQNPILGIETMNLTIESSMSNIGVAQKPYVPEASMVREYDLFEKFPDGSSLWRVSVSGLGNARLHLHELTRRSENQFYAIDITAGKTLHLGRVRRMLGFSPPRKARSQGDKMFAQA
jgi:hypothetical protein